MTEQEKIIRTALETRLGQAFKLDRGSLPSLSISEILSLLFALWGHTNSLGSFGESMSAIQELIGPELLWKRPTNNSNESTVVN